MHLRVVRVEPHSVRPRASCSQCWRHPPEQMFQMENVRSSAVEHASPVLPQPSAAAITHCHGPSSLLLALSRPLDLRTAFEPNSTKLSLSQALATSLDLFITLYDDSAFDVDPLCSKFAKCNRERGLRCYRQGPRSDDVGRYFKNVNEGA